MRDSPYVAAPSVAVVLIALVAVLYPVVCTPSRVESARGRVVRVERVRWRHGSVCRVRASVESAHPEDYDVLDESLCDRLRTGDEVLVTTAHYGPITRFGVTPVGRRQ